MVTCRIRRSQFMRILRRLRMCASNLVIGVNITLDILFKKEHVITPTDFNMSGRVRIFNDQGQLVGEWMSSEGTYVPPNNEPVSCTVNGVAQNGRSVAADGTSQFPFGPLRAVVPQPLPLNTYNFIPGGTNLLHVTIAGLPQVPAATRNAPAVTGFLESRRPCLHSLWLLLCPSLLLRTPLG